MPRPVKGNHYGAVVSGFFISPTSSVLHTILSTCMGGVEENTDPLGRRSGVMHPRPLVAKANRIYRLPLKREKAS